MSVKNLEHRYGELQRDREKKYLRFKITVHKMYEV